MRASFDDDGEDTVEGDNGKLKFIAPVAFLLDAIELLPEIALFGLAIWSCFAADAS